MAGAARRGGVAAAVVLFAVLGAALPAAPSAAAPAQVPPSVDLRVAAPDPSGLFTFSSPMFDVTNLGGTAATGVVVEVSIPAGVAVDRATIGWFAIPCAIRLTTVSCPMGNVAVGQTRFVAIDIHMLTPGEKPFVATVTGAQPDPDPTNNTATHTLDAPTPDLGVQVDVPDVVEVEELFSAYALVDHAGTRSPGSTVVVEVSPGLSLETAAIGWFAIPCTIVGSTATCPLGTLEGNSRFVVLGVRATAPGTPTVTATVSSAGPDWNAANDVDSATVPVGPVELVDLVMYDIENPIVVGPGEAFSVTLNVSNQSEDVTATGVEMATTIPDGFGITSAATSHGNGCTIDGRYIVCDLDEIRPTYSEWMRVELVGAPTWGDHEVIGTVTADQPDARPADNSGSRFVVVGPPDFNTYFSWWPTTATVGTTFGAQVQVGNRGADSMTVRVDISADAGLVIESAAIGYFSRPCTVTGSTAICQIGPLTGTESFIGLKIRPTQPGARSIRAVIGEGEPDSDPTNNTAIATVTVAAAPAP